MSLRIAVIAHHSLLADGIASRLREHGGPTADATADTFVTQDGGLLVAATAGTLAGTSGGLWLVKVPLSDGAITFAPGSGATSAPLAFDASAPWCLQSPSAPTTTSPLAISLWSKTITARPVTLDVRSQ